MASAAARQDHSYVRPNRVTPVSAKAPFVLAPRSFTGGRFNSHAAPKSNSDLSEIACASGNRTPLAHGQTVRLFGVDLFDTTVAAASAWIVDRALRNAATQVSFLNAHCVNVMYRDDKYREAVAGSDRIFADGSGIGIAGRMAGIKFRENVNGTDLFPVLCKDAAAASVSLFLFGSQSGVANRAASRMARDNPRLSIAGTHHGFIAGNDEENRLIDRINASGAQIVLVGIGVPAQELWITRNRHRLCAPVIIGVGGLFDYYSDRIPRAPLLLRGLGCEWVWRLAMEPRRLARRYLLGNLEFLARLAWMRLTDTSDFNQHATNPATR